MPSINELTQLDLEQQIKNAIIRMGMICKDPLMVTQMPEYSQQLLSKFIEYADNTRLFANQPKENIAL